MIAVIFEVWPEPAHKQDYLDTAAELRPLLENFEGFVSIERFESLVTPGKLLSLSYWESEEALERWRNVEAHRTAQARGRAGLFTGYRIKIAHVLRDYGMDDRDQAPQDSRAVHG